ncbi:hypothetical protein [uncultured Ruegeria sp.]|uniref:hypothetical protein n=1 Tax=uncultured Ruegeria sp. TaxID=259304 RepID=UPI00260C0820|nr:hypothetical protein [uncultured Ruegeria sp.]
MTIRDYRATTRAPGPAGTPQISLKRAGDNSGTQALGAGIANAGEILARATQEREMNDARLTMTEGLGEINRELADDTDFATMPDRYEARLKGLHKQVMSGLRTNRTRSSMGLEFARAKVAAEANVFRRRDALEGSHARATLGRTLRAAANYIPTAGSPEEAGETYGRAQASIDSLLEAGHITAEDAERYRITLDRDVSFGLVLSDINQDPAMAAEKLSEPGAYGLDEVDRQRQLSVAQRAADQQDKAVRSKLEKRVDTARGILVRGGVVDQEELNELRNDVRGSDLGIALEGAISASQTLGGFAQATPEERAAHLAAEREKGISIDDATIGGARLTTLEQIDQAANQALAKDPIAFAVEQRFEGAGQLDLGDQNSINDRLALGELLMDEYGAPGRFFTNDEKSYYADLLAEGSDQDQLAFVASVIAGLGPAAGAAFRELDGIDPTIRHAGQLVIETGNTDVAAIILKGHRAQNSGEELRVPREDALAVFEEELDGVLGAVGGRREEMVAATKAYYAAMAPGRVAQDDVRAQTSLLREAAQKVMGQVTFNGRTFGGVQPVNGRNTRLPSTLDADSTERLLTEATPEHWAAGSISGNGPHEGDDLVLPDDAVLQWVNGSIYRVGVPSRRGGIEYYQDPRLDNGFFYVDLNKMAEAFLRNPPDRKDPPVLGQLREGALQ